MWFLVFIRSPLGRYAMLALAVVAILGGLYAAGAHHGADAVHKADAKADSAASAKAAKTNGETAALATSAGQAAAQSQTQIAQKAAAIKQRVRNEIPAASDVRLSPDWLSIYNGSLGLLPDSAGAPPGAAHGPGVLPSADALETIADNDAKCLVWKDRAERLTAFYDGVRLKVNGK